MSPTAEDEKVLGQALQQGVYCLPGQTSVIMLAPPPHDHEGRDRFCHERL